jgi:hypothetical protein
MSTWLSQNLPEALKSVRTRPLFRLREAVPPLLVVGQTPNAFRRIGVIQGALLRGNACPVKSLRAMTGRMCAKTPRLSEMCVWC